MAQSLYIAQGTHGLQVYLNNYPRLTFDLFLYQGQICIPVHSYGGKIENSVSQNVLKTSW